MKYTINSQSSRGGWYYTSKTEGGDRDEGSVTITQVQALRAARNAGIPVPKDVIKKCYQYLKDCTSPNGAVYYSYQSKTERAAITAAAIACLFNAGEYKDELCKKWFKYCQRAIPYIWSKIITVALYVGAFALFSLSLAHLAHLAHFSRQETPYSAHNFSVDPLSGAGTAAAVKAKSPTLNRWGLAHLAYTTKPRSHQSSPTNKL